MEGILTLGEDGPAMLARNIVNGNSIYTCGFYLGMAYNPVWGMEKEQNPYNTLTPLYSAILTSAGVEFPVIAPDNLGVYVSSDASTILVKERFGKATSVALEIKDFPGVIFGGAATACDAGGKVQLNDFAIEPYGTLVLHKVGSLSLTGGKGISWTCKPSSDGNLDLTISGTGKVIATFGLKPKAIYSASENGQLSMVFTAGEDGKHKMMFTLGAKPLRLLIKPSNR